MANVTRIFVVAGTESLANLQTIIRQNENIVGPLVALSPWQDRDTVLTLEVGAAPGGLISLLQTAGAAPAPQPGHQLVCIGDCYVGGAIIRVAAYR